MTSKKHSDWDIPREAIGVMGSLFFVPAIAVLSATILPAVSRLQNANPIPVLAVGYIAGFAGAILLFFARLPLYRQRRYWTFGPRELDSKHRKMYWIAYALVLICMLLLLSLWMRVRAM